MDQLGGAESSCVHQLKHGPVPPSGISVRKGLLQQMVHFLTVQRSGQAHPDPCQFDADKGIPVRDSFPQQVLVKSPDSRQSTVHGTCGKSRAFPFGEIGHDNIGGNFLGNCATAFSGKSEVAVQVAAIGVQSVSRASSFNEKAVQILIQKLVHGMFLTQMRRGSKAFLKKINLLTSNRAYDNRTDVKCGQVTSFFISENLEKRPRGQSVQMAALGIAATSRFSHKEVIVTLNDVKEILNADVLVGQDQMEMEVKTAFGADLMSDVLAFAKSGSLLLTGLTNPQVIRTSDILDIAAIVMVRGKKPVPETIRLAEELKIPVLSTKYILFETAGRLYEKGIKGCVERVDSNIERP